MTWNRNRFVIRYSDWIHNLCGPNSRHPQYECVLYQIDNDDDADDVLVAMVSLVGSLSYQHLLRVNCINCIEYVWVVFIELWLNWWFGNESNGIETSKSKNNIEIVHRSLDIWYGTHHASDVYDVIFTDFVLQFRHANVAAYRLNNTRSFAI